MENIFEQTGVSYKVWNRDNDDRRNESSSTLIVKLHGCVKNKKAGYIFDEEEYINFLNDDDCFSRDFGDAYSKGDVIFIGTEFQENDLKTIISKYNSVGYDVSGNNYFFITPTIHNVSLKRKITTTENYHWIQWETEKFFDFLYKEVILEKNSKKILEEKGLVSIDDLYKERAQRYESKLFAGYESRYDDFFEEWDIIHPGLVEFEERIIEEGKNTVAAIIGKSYVGKSCAAKRILIDFRKKGFLVFEFNMRSSEYMHLFLEYIEQLPQDTKIAILFEEASFYFNLLYIKRSREGSHDKRIPPYYTEKELYSGTFCRSSFLVFRFCQRRQRPAARQTEIRPYRRRTLHAFGSQPSDRLRNKFAFVYPLLPVFGRQPGISRPLPIFAGGSPSA